MSCVHTTMFPPSITITDSKRFLLSRRFEPNMKDLAVVSPFLRAVSVTILVLTCLTVLPNAQAQAAGITSIANVQYSSQAVMQNGIARATVVFTVYYNYYYNPQGYLVFGIYDTSTSNLVKGSAAASPDPCQSLAGTSYADSAVCAIVPAMNSGTDSASMILTFNSAQQYNLNIRSFILDSRNLQSGNQVSGSSNAASVTISVTGQTVSTSSTATSSSSTAISSTSASSSTTLTASAATVTAPISSMSTNTPSEQPTSNYTEPIVVIALIVAVAAAIIFVASRRRTARPPSTKMRENLERAPKPSGSFCTNCGARIPEGNTFCSQCGTKQK